MESNPTTFEENLLKDLYTYLKIEGETDDIMPDAPDIEEKWVSVANAYLPDGVREFQDYPLTSLGWVMYVGMAVAQKWDNDWENFSVLEDPYAVLRDVRGYDEMDEYIAQEVLGLDPKRQDELAKLVGNCATRTYNYLMRHGIEPGTAQAVQAYISCLHQLYLMGACVQLHRMGYHMTKMS